MSPVSLPNVPASTDYFPLSGGLNQESPALSLKPGFSIDCANYVPSISGGYRRSGEYERYDGHAKPSDASYWIIPATITGTIASGDTITGATSGATSKAIATASGQVIVTKKTGTYTAGETLNVSGSPVATGVGTVIQDAAATNVLHCSYRNLAADVYRADIAAVPGSGSILGVWYYNGVLYAFRNNAGATAAVMYKSTASGWAEVTLLYTVAYTAGGGATPAEGGTLTQGGVTATVRRIMNRTGAWSGTAAGKLLISAPAGGNFAAGAATIGATTLTLSAAQSQIALTPSGRYEFVNYNFTGSTDTLRMYGCDGVNPAFEFDGTYYAPIGTGMTTDTPSHIAAHKNHLFLSFRGSVQHSSIGSPFAWTAVLGASEIAMGDTVTNFINLPGSTGGGALCIYTRNTTAVLYGSSSSDWNLVPVSPENGAIAYTVQRIGEAFALDDMGLITLSATQNYGNFSASTVTRLVQTFINSKKGLAIASHVVRDNNEYRVWFTDGWGLSVVMNGGNIQCMPVYHANAITCCCNATDTSGNELIFFGSSNGMVYQSAVGTSQDGADIEAWVRTAFNSSKSPNIRKRYRRAIVECSADEYFEFAMSFDCSYGSIDFPTSSPEDKTVAGGGLYWDQFTWDEFSWDTQAIEQPRMKLEGTGTNISFLFYANSDLYKSHVLQGVSFDFSPRRPER